MRWEPLPLTPLVLASQLNREEKSMSGLEQIEIAKYNRELVGDVHHLVGKYCRIMSWEVPELDEKEASRLIFGALRSALDEAEKG